MQRTPRIPEPSRLIARQQFRRAISRSVPIRSSPHGCEGIACRPAAAVRSGAVAFGLGETAAALSAHPANSTAAACYDDTQPRAPEADPGRQIARQTALGALHHGLSHANQAAPLRAQRFNTAQEGESPDDRVKDTALQPRHRSIRTRTAPRLQQPQVDMDRTPRTRELSRLIARQHSHRSIARVENRTDSRTSPIHANPHGCREIAHRPAHRRAAFEGVARRLAQDSHTAAAAPSAPQANSTAAASHNNMQPKAHAPRHGRLTARQLKCRGPMRRSTSSSGLSGSMQATAAEAGSRP